MKILAFAAVAAVCLSVPVLAQRNEIAIGAIGNWNPVSYIHIQNDPHEVISSNRSSVGGGVSYQSWLTGHIALGVQYEQNPSAGKLFWIQKYYRWPQTRHEIAAFSSQQIIARKVSIFVREGAGSILTNGYGNSGWSHDFALLFGAGVDYRVSPRFVVRTGLTVLTSKTGCYNDKTCKPTWAAIDDASTGLAWRF